jgi:thioredoxin-like negative regulator of GroEL
MYEFMEISIKVLTGKGCKCCDNLRPKMDELAEEKGFSLEYVDVGDINDLPVDLTGIPYIILNCDGQYINSWQGDMSKELIIQKIDRSIEIHNKRLEMEKNQ